jgi:acyl-CoA synthetase (AMP-forming)/AMP-acid ligase II
MGALRDTADLSPPRTVGAALLGAAERWPAAEAFVTPEIRWSYADLHDQATSMARTLNAMGLNSGDRVGVAADDGPELVALLLGAAMCGVVPILFAQREGVRASVLAPRLPILQPKAYFILGADGEAFAKVLPKAQALAGQAATAPIALDGDVFQDFVRAGAANRWDAEAAARKVKPEQDLAVVFTSGVTGLPKTCPISHWNVLCKAGPFRRRFELEQGDRLWIGVRMHQIGYVTPLLIALAAGATVLSTGDMDCAHVRKLLGGERVTHAYPIYLGNWQPIIYAPDFRPSDFSELSHVCLVGPSSALRRVQRALPHALVSNTYGSAEEAGAFCMPRPDDPSEVRLGSSGRPFPGHEIRIVDPDTGEVCPRSVIGEIQVRGEGVPAPSPQGGFGSLYSDDGWLRSSDLGLIGETGELTYRGRLTELLKVGGEVISALEIETILLDHREVAIAQVVGRKDPKLGEVAAAFVELRPGSTVTAEQLAAFCATRLPRAFVPRYIRFVSEWPTASSKIYKPLLADMPAGPRINL